MAKQVVFNSLNQLKSYLKLVEPANKSVFILFTGDKDEKTGKSWCPDCNDADPIIKNKLQLLSDNAEFITCFVGERSAWKDQQNEYRLDKEFRLNCIPTLVAWKKNKSLKEEQCADESLVQMLFEDEN